MTQGSASRERGNAPLETTSSSSATPEPPLQAPFARAGAGWPFVPLAPLLVVVVGLAVAAAIGLVGLDSLTRAGERHAGERAELLAATVAARLAQLPPDRRLEAAELAARRSAAEIVVVVPSPQGPPRILHDVTLGLPDPTALEKMLRSDQGVVEKRFGRLRYAVRPIGLPAAESPRIVVLVAEPSAPAGAGGLATALAAFVVLLLVVAATVAYFVSRDVTREVEFVTRRVSGMAQVRAEPTGELIPARTMDVVGLLTSAFNKLVGRFGSAENAYREDLMRADLQDKERAAFLAAVSHELRSPLNAILGFADILMTEVDGPLTDSAKEEVEQIIGSGKHLLELINDILELSALESGQLRLSRGRVDLFELANEVVREARVLVGGRDVSVRIEGDPVLARIDARRVRQIIGNLVGNAVKFTQRGEVVVRVSKQGGLVAIAVSDTGPGISRQDRALIFEEYKQARGEQKRRRGTGLGLAIARRLVWLHAGSIQLESEVGRGSTFRVILPIGNIEAPASKLPPPPEPRREA